MAGFVKNLMNKIKGEETVLNDINVDLSDEKITQKPVNNTNKESSEQNITEKDIADISTMSGKTQKEVVAELQKKGLTIPQEITEKINALSNSKESATEPENILPETNPIKKSKEGKEVGEEDKISELFESGVKLLESLFRAGDYKKIATEFSKEDIVRVDDNGTKVTRQGAVREAINDDISNMQKLSGEEKEKEKGRILKNIEDIDLNGSDLAETRKVTVRGQESTDRLSVNSKNDEEAAKLIEEKGVAGLKEAQTRNEFTPGSDQSQLAKRSDVMKEMKGKWAQRVSSEETDNSQDAGR